MKFLCPSCKAKYQIADEKIAGRSVRMKCRKCGFIIPLNEAPEAPETIAPSMGEMLSASVVPPAPPAPKLDSAAPLAADAAPPARAPARPLAAPPAPSPPKPAAPKPAPLARKPAAPAPKAAAAPKPAPAARPATPPPARSMSPVPGSRPGPRPAARPVGPAARPVAPAPFTKPVPPTTAAALAPSPPSEPAPASAQRPSPTVSSPPAPRVSAPPALHSSTPPTRPSAGPARPAAAAAAAYQPARAAAAPPVAPQAPDSDYDDEEEETRIAHSTSFTAPQVEPEVPAAHAQGHGTPAGEWFVGIRGVPSGPMRLNELRTRAAVGEITVDTLVWRDGYSEWKAIKEFPELVAVVEESLSSVRASAAPLPTPPALPKFTVPVVKQEPKEAPDAMLVPDPFAARAVSPAVTGSALVSDDLVAAGLRKQPSPVAVWAAIVIALLLGLTIGFVVWNQRKEPETIVKYVTVPAEAKAAAAVADAPALEAAAPGSESLAERTKKGQGPLLGAKPTTSVATAAKPEEPPLPGLKGLSGLSAGGPSGPSGEQATGPSGAGQLDSAQVQSTVGRYTGSVKRSCWQPALDARDPSAPASARVNVTITVAPSGSVQNVTTSGDPKGYPGLGGCIAGRVRGWQFPPSSGGPTTVQVPFVFAAQ